MTTYKDAGVDVDAGDHCSRIAADACKRTHANRNGKFGDPRALDDGFAGPVGIDRELDGYLVKNADGVGSKALVAQRTGQHDTIAHDLIAMNVDDTVAVGAEPVFATNTLDVHNADPDLVDDLMAGLEEACRDAGIAMVGGEIAELPDQVQGHDLPYIWNADVIGVLDDQKHIERDAVTVGDAVLVVRSNGMRSNGLTLARTICHDAFGDAWHVEPFRDTTWGDALLAPSIIVCDAVLDVIGRYGEPPQASVTGMAHVTGGGITNAARMLPDDRGAYLPDLFDPHPVFTALQEYGDVADREAYRTWNMGQCFLIATPEPDAVTRILTENNLDVREAGVVTEEPGIVMESKGVDGGRIRYE